MRFGTAGIPLGKGEKLTSLTAMPYLKEIGLSAMELEFVHSVNLSQSSAKLLKPIAEKNNISLSVHASYYINLNSKDRSKIKASQKRIIDASKRGYQAGAKKIVFHPGFMHSQSEKEVIEKISESISQILEYLKKEKINVQLAPETTGKPSQFGSLEQILSLLDRFPSLSMTIDFSHLHARERGKFKTKKDFDNVFSVLPKKIIKDIHIHASGIVYSEKGEKYHVPFTSKENTFPYKLFISSLKDSGAKGTLICESPLLEKDALLLKKLFSE